MRNTDSVVLARIRIAWVKKLAVFSVIAMVAITRVGVVSGWGTDTGMLARLEHLACVIVLTVGPVVPSANKHVFQDSKKLKTSLILP